MPTQITDTMSEIIQTFVALSQTSESIRSRAVDAINEFAEMVDSNIEESMILMHLRVKLAEFNNTLDREIDLLAAEFKKLTMKSVSFSEKLMVHEYELADDEIDEKKKEMSWVNTQCRVYSKFGMTPFAEEVIEKVRVRMGY